MTASAHSGISQLKLTKPIVFFDLETTGLNVAESKIVELYAVKITPSGERESIHHLVNPGIPIPKIASDIHGITDDAVRDKPQFPELAQAIADFMRGADFGGFNIKKFDLPLLAAEFKRAGVDFAVSNAAVIDVQQIFHSKEPRHLAAAYSFYCGEELIGAHSASTDVEACLSVFSSQLDRYDDLPRDIEGLNAYCNPSQTNWADPEGKFTLTDGEPVFNFGKYRGKKLSDVAATDAGYLSWIASSDFTDVVKDLVRKALSNNEASLF